MNLDGYKEDLDRLVRVAWDLLRAMAIELEDESAEQIPEAQRKNLPDFRRSYQSWYSEALKCVAQLLPDRLQDFVSHYQPSKNRKELTHGNYTISDYLRGLRRTNIVEPSAALSVFYQQAQIVESLRRRFEGSLFDIRALVQADLFDSELEAAEEINGKGFQRGAGAIAGVVLEGHLATVLESHKVPIPKNPTISKLNDALKSGDVIDQPTWRFIQHLGDLRNLCDHKRGPDPTTEQIQELITGTRKITKTVL